MQLKGEVVYRGQIVPVTVEITKGWLGINAVVIHIPPNMPGSGIDYTHIIDFSADESRPMRPYKDENGDPNPIMETELR